MADPNGIIGDHLLKASTHSDDVDDPKVTTPSALYSFAHCEGLTRVLFGLQWSHTYELARLGPNELHIGRECRHSSSATKEPVLHVVVLDVETRHRPIHQGRGEPCCVLNGDLLRAPSLLLILRQLPPILLQKDLPP